MNHLTSLNAAEPNRRLRRNVLLQIGIALVSTAALLLVTACDNSVTTSTARESQNIRTIEKVYKGFETGDIESILALMADDVEWVHPGPKTIPFAGAFQGKDGVEQFFAIAIEHLDVLDQTVGDLVAHEDRVAAFGSEHMRVKTTGLEYQSNWIHVYTIKDDKIVRFEEYIDTASVAAGFQPDERQSSGTNQD